MKTADDTDTSRASHVAIALVSATLVLFEVLVTRVLSVTLAYHFAFMAVSLAMLGLGAPGIWFSFFPPGRRALAWSLIASAVSLPLAMLLIINFGAPLRTVMVFWVACVLIPLGALGSVICVLLLRAEGPRIGRMYSADLVGAAAGAVLVVPLLHGLPTPKVIAILGALPLLALALLHIQARIYACLGAAALCASVVIGPGYHLTYSSMRVDDAALPVYDKWTPTAHLTIFTNRLFQGWGYGSKVGPSVSKFLWLDQDGSAGTQILAHKPGGAFPPELMFDVSSVPYQLARPKQACIIGGGGGRDILTAMQAGSSRIEVVELNPYTIDAVSHDFGAFSGDPYHAPGVSAFADEGRSHYMRSSVRCDVFQISQIDTFAATAAGAFALSENGLYTVEALEMYWNKLTPDGVASITRWSAGPGAIESARLVLLAQEMLQQNGVKEPTRYMVVVEGGASANLLLFRKPVSDTMLARVHAVVEQRGFRMLWPDVPHIPPQSLVELALRYGESPFRYDGYDVSPPTDDRPFFFQQADVLRGLKHKQEGDDARANSVTLLRSLLAIVSIASCVLFFAPFLLRNKMRGISSPARGTTFFAAIGLGFMFVEIPLMQRLALYLGHPSYSATVVLGALLLGSGVGASLAAKLPKRKARIALLMVSVAVAVLVLPLVGPISHATLSWSLPARVMIAGSVVFCVGLALGQPFVLGMSRFDGRARAWYWAVNGAAGVLASVLALVLSIVLGFAAVLGLSLACYLVAALVFPESGELSTTS